MQAIETKTPKLGDHVTVLLGGREWPHTLIESIKFGQYGVDIFGFKYIPRTAIIAIDAR